MSALRLFHRDPERPTLRQRLAALKTSTARPKAQPAVPASEPPPVPTVGSAVADGDPALSLIAAHRAAYAAWKPLGDVTNDAIVGSPEYRAAEMAEAGPRRAEIKAFNAVIAARPTSPAGLRALAGYLPEAVRANSVSDPDTDAMIALRTVCGSVLALVTDGSPVVCEPDPSASPMLLDLIARHRAALARADDPSPKTDVEADVLADEAWGLFRQACAYPIASPADLAAKLTVIVPEIDEGFRLGRSNTDEYAWLCLRADLTRPGALAAPTSPETTLATLTVPQLARLHETAATLWHSTSMFLNAPFAWDDGRENYGPLGRIIVREADRLEELASAAAREARGRTQGDDERDERFGILVRHGILGGGPLDDREIIAEVAQAWSR